MKKLYVGNLPYTTEETALRALFSEHGEIDHIHLIEDRDTGRLKGFGFIEFTTPEGAEKALVLDGQDFDGRPLKVNMARPKESGGGRGGFSQDNRRNFKVQEKIEVGQ